MIIITEHAAQITEWIDANCPAPSHYTINDGVGDRKTIKLRRGGHCGIVLTLTLTDDDMMLFLLRFGDQLIHDASGDIWYDRTEAIEALLTRMMAHAY